MRIEGTDFELSLVQISAVVNIHKIKILLCKIFLFLAQASNCRLHLLLLAQHLAAPQQVLRNQLCSRLHTALRGARNCRMTTSRFTLTMMSVLCRAKVLMLFTPATACSREHEQQFARIRKLAAEACGTLS